MKMQERKKKRRMRKLRTWAAVSVLVLLIASAIFALKAPYFNVRGFLISGTSYYTADEIIMMGEHHIIVVR